MVQSPSNDAAHSSYDDDLKKNADGSIDLYFGPQAPSGGRATGSRPYPGAALPDVPLLHPHRAAVRRHVVTARYRADLTTLIGGAPMKASRAATSWQLHIS
jgi:hypothetical protein